MDEVLPYEVDEVHWLPGERVDGDDVATLVRMSTEGGYPTAEVQFDDGTKATLGVWRLRKLAP